MLNARERTQKRILSDSFGPIKLTKIPENFINFDNIKFLPSRELAYTAHIANRTGLENQDLWERVRDAFLDSLGEMKSKHVTQCVIALSDNRALSKREVEGILRSVVEKIQAFRTVDLILILNSVSRVDNSGTLQSFASELASRNFALESHKSIAILLVSIGKLGIQHD